MEANISPYADSPRAFSPADGPPSSSFNFKPVGKLPHRASASCPAELYHGAPVDVPENAITDPMQPLHNRQQHYSDGRSKPQRGFSSYTDATSSDNDDEEVPLAYLYPMEAPPSYMASVRYAYQSTLVSHIRNDSHLSAETAEREYAEEPRFKVEKAVAMFVVALVLSVISGLLIVSVLFYRGRLSHSGS